MSVEAVEAVVAEADSPGIAPVARTRAMLERSLSSYLPEEDVEPKAIHRAMRYAVLNGGHRWRPLLTLFAAEACGGREKDVLPTACAFELLHCTSLILDDLPCMDDAELRRDRPACHKVFGEAVTIMAAISLLSLAHRLVLDNCRALGLPAGATHKFLQEVFALTMSEGMIAGQFADLNNDAAPLDGTSLVAAHHSKTGLLCIAAVRAGALLVRATDHQVACLEQYATQLGLAYQIQDDLQDAVGDTVGLNMPGNSELGKTTFASYYGLPGAMDRLKDVGEAALDALEPFGAGAAKFRHLACKMIPVAIA